MNTYISKTDLFELLNRLSEEYQVYVPIRKENQRFYRKYDNTGRDNIVIGEVRAFEPLKAFFMRAREVVAEDFKVDVPHLSHKPFCIVGVKSCDLKGFKIQDYVFKNHDYKDPFYIKNRQDNLVISTDCTCAIDTCFCLSLNVKPYPQEDFDINLSQVNGGFLVEAGSEKGERIVGENASLFGEIPRGADAQVQKRRAEVIRQVEENIRENNVPFQETLEGIIERQYESDIWKEEAETCVECGACNAICPTCHCFLLYDQKDEERMKRLRIWDSCLIKDFARVAGGANPRPKLWMRLRNRFEKKFDFFPRVADIYACTGCGRCISACPGKIDIRRVLRRLKEKA